MNIDRHVKAHLDLYENLAKGEHEKAKATKDFYDEYFAVLDLAAEDFSDPKSLVEAKRLMRALMTHYLGGKSLETRKIFLELQEL